MSSPEDRLELMEYRLSEPARREDTANLAQCLGRLIAAASPFIDIELKHNTFLSEHRKDVLYDVIYASRQLLSKLGGGK